MSETEWRPALGFGGKIEVSDAGDARRAGTHRPLTLGSRALYKTIGGRVDGVFRSASLHGAVAAAFIGPRPSGHVIDHVDGDKHNNAVSNLQYVTPAENTRRAIRLGLLQHRPRCPADWPVVAIELPRALYERLCEVARNEYRTVGQQIHYLLGASFAPVPTPPKTRSAV